MCWAMLSHILYYVWKRKMYTTNTHTHLWYMWSCSKFIVVKLPHHPKRKCVRLSWPNNRNTLLCFSPAECVPALLALLIYSREKHGHCLSIDGHSLARLLAHVMWMQANERLSPSFSCLIICYYIVISISLYQVHCTFYSLLLESKRTTISKYCWKSILEMN